MSPKGHQIQTNNDGILTSMPSFNIYNFRQNEKVENKIMRTELKCFKILIEGSKITLQTGEQIYI